MDSGPGFGEPRQLTLLQSGDIGNRAEPCTPEQCVLLHCALVIIYRDGAPHSELELMRRVFPNVKTKRQQERERARAAESVLVAMMGTR